VKYGRLTVIGASTGGKSPKVLCRCECGTEKLIATGSIRSGDTRSCGCLHKETAGAHLKKHGMFNRPEHTVWRKMVERCTSPKCKDFPRYGGRGVGVCAAWLESFANFYADMGPRPDGMSIDRIDNDGNYEPANCRWATKAQQSANRSDNVHIEHCGRRQTLTQWANEAGLRPGTLWHRIRAGWPAERALTTPSTINRKQNHVV